MDDEIVGQTFSEWWIADDDDAGEQITDDSKYTDDDVGKVDRCPEGRAITYRLFGGNVVLYAVTLK
jgi:hypothetical protein